MEVRISQELREAVKKAAHKLGPETPHIVLEPPFQSFHIVSGEDTHGMIFASFPGADVGRADMTSVHLIMEWA